MIFSVVVALAVEILAKYIPFCNPDKLMLFSLVMLLAVKTTLPVTSTMLTLTATSELIWMTPVVGLGNTSNCFALKVVLTDQARAAHYHPQYPGDVPVAELMGLLPPQSERSSNAEQLSETRPNLKTTALDRLADSSGERRQSHHYY